MMVRAGGGSTVLLGAFSHVCATRRAALRSALCGSAPVQPDGAWRSLWSTVRPDIVVASGLGVAGLLVALLRRVMGRTTALVFLPEPPRRMGMVGRFILRAVDGVLVDGEAAASAVSGLSDVKAVTRLAPELPLDRFLEIEPDRPAPFARRMVVVSDLTPGSGAADLLQAVSTWSEAHPEQRVYLSWIGEGDLAGLLAAQPLPGNLFQAFLGPLDGERLAAVLSQCGLLVVPSILDATRAPVAEALAAGLPVLGSRRSREVRRFVVDGVNGWLVDPLAPGALLGALVRALGMDDAGLRAMRARARGAVTARPSGSLPNRKRGRDGSLTLQPAGHGLPGHPVP